MMPLSKSFALTNSGSLFSTYQSYIEPLIGKIVTGSVSIRKIHQKDNNEVRVMIQKILIRKGGIGTDQYYFDEELSDLSGSYNEPGGCFYVMLYNGEIVGCIGMKPSQEDQQIAEIKKFYFLSKNADEEGHENGLIQTIKSRAYQMGFKSCFITIEQRDITTLDMFEKNGFHQIPAGSNYTSNSIRLQYEF